MNYFEYGVRLVISWVWTAEKIENSSSASWVINPLYFPKLTVLISILILRVVIKYRFHNLMLHTILWFIKCLKLLHWSQHPLPSRGSITLIKEVSLLRILELELMRDGSLTFRDVQHSHLILRIVTVVKVQIWNEINMIKIGEREKRD